MELDRHSITIELTTERGQQPSKKNIVDRVVSNGFEYTTSKACCVKMKMKTVETFTAPYSTSWCSNCNTFEGDIK